MKRSVIPPLSLVIILLVVLFSKKTDPPVLKIIIGGVILVALPYLISLIRRQKVELIPGLPTDFKDEPFNSDGKYITLQGRVVKIFSDTLAEFVKRKFIDKFRKISGNDDRRGRYIHQRFLITSPALRFRQYILVENQVTFGKVKLRKGCVVELRGQYLHSKDKKKNHFYGKIHSTHPPKGYIKRVDGTPMQGVPKNR